MNRTTVPEDRREAYYNERMRECGPQYDGFDLMSAEVTVSFLYTYDIFHQLLSRALAQYGLSRSTLNILMLLRHGPAEGMQLHDLGELLLVSRANITGLMHHLEQKGYVRRVVDSADRRARFARITKKAEALLDELMPLHYAHLKSMLQDLSDDEKRSLLGLFRKTRTSIRAHSEFREQNNSTDHQSLEQQG